MMHRNLTGGDLLDLPGILAGAEFPVRRTSQATKIVCGSAVIAAREEQRHCPNLGQSIGESNMGGDVLSPAAQASWAL